MDKWVGALLALAIIVLVLGALLRSWRLRTRRDVSLGILAVPVDLGRADLEVDSLYVATTPVGQPHERLAIRGLAFRGAAHVEVHRTGIVLRIVGERASFIPADRISAAGSASFAIDRVVERDGLVVVTWAAHNDRAGAASDTNAVTIVDSYVRTREPADAARLISTITDIAAARVAPQPHPESEASDD